MVQVIAIGYGRTGTESLREALAVLGYKTFHTKTMMLQQPEMLETWYRNTTATALSPEEDSFCPLDLKEFLEGYTAATGMLFAVCLEQALNAFPDAHFILTKRRSTEEWFQSWSTLIDATSLLPRYAPWLPRAKQLDYYNRWLLSWIHDKDTSFFTRNHPIQQDPILAQQSYLQHIETARRLIPPHQLLELETGSAVGGWKPLCGYLNVSIPNIGVAYPHRNSTHSMVWQCRMSVIAANLVLLVVLYGLTKVITRWTQQPKAKLASPGVKVEKDNQHKVTAVIEEDEDDYIPTVRILPEETSSSNTVIATSTNSPRGSPDYLLTVPQMQQLAIQALPAMVALRCWKRVYRLSRDGDDFQTFLNATKGMKQSLLIIQSTKNQLFGAFADSLWDASERQNYNILVSSGAGTGFYGSTLACLFTFETIMKGKREREGMDHRETACSSDYDGKKKSSLSVFKWSGVNRYIQMFDIHTGRVAFGGGAGAAGNNGFGLCIEDNFSRGTTSSCETFQNSFPLTGDYNEENFAILDVEVWAFPHGTLG